jgi:hypothetical protein
MHSFARGVMPPCQAAIETSSRRPASLLLTSLTRVATGKAGDIAVGCGRHIRQLRDPVE